VGRSRSGRENTARPDTAGASPVAPARWGARGGALAGGAAGRRRGRCPVMQA